VEFNPSSHSIFKYYSRISGKSRGQVHMMLVYDANEVNYDAYVNDTAKLNTKSEKQ